MGGGGEGCRGTLGLGRLHAAGSGPAAEVEGSLREAAQPLPRDALLHLRPPYVLVQLLRLAPRAAPPPLNIAGHLPERHTLLALFPRRRCQSRLGDF